jgi:hypothetical protein
VFSLPGLDPDLGLAEALPYCQPASAFSQRIEWPELNPSQWTEPLRQALLEELREDLAAIRQRQAAYLRREMDRIDDYFSGYAEELKGRLRRQHSQANAAKLEQRLAAAKAEHLRRRDDQVQRHEIRVRSHLDALLLLAEPAWRVSLSTTSHSGQHLHQAHFIQRLRLWTELS